MQIFEKRLTDIRPYEKNPRKNDGAVQYVANSIKEFGFKVPIVIDKDGVIVAGHTRYKAAEQLGLETVPCIVADDLSDNQIKAFRLADNKTGEIAEWDFDFLNEELNDLFELDMNEFGFEKENDVEKNNERESISLNETICVVIDCENEEQAEIIFNDLQKEGYECRISTL